MDTHTLTEDATLKRFNAQQDRVARDFGYGDTTGGLGVTQDALAPFTAFIQSKFDSIDTLYRKTAEYEALDVLRQLPAETVALAVLNAALDTIGRCEDAIAARAAIGSALRSECFAAGLLKHDADLAERIARRVVRRHGSLKYRQQAARSLAARQGFVFEHWGRRKELQAGELMARYLLDALPTVFVEEEVPGASPFLTITPEALAVAESAVERALRSHPAFFPCTELPRPWTGYHEGGFWDWKSRFRAPVVRAYYPETRAVIKAAIADGSMQPTLDALNTLQSTAWTINHRVLGVIRGCVERGIAVKGLPSVDLALPEKPAAWETMDDDARRLWRYRASQVKQKNRSNVSNRVLLVQDLKTAEHLSAYPRFYTPMNLDWRGRVYSTTHFNFQRDDRVRALFMFADGEPIGEEGLYWLKVHVANCGDFDKMSKQPFAERVKWVDENLEMIEQIATTPLPSHSMWLSADKPFMFLAGCMELTSALKHGDGYVTRLPISFDGSCSGLQHLSAMTRDADTAKLVNLTPSETMHDVYQVVASAVVERVKAVATSGSEYASIAARALAFGIDRKLVKRNVMTYSYSSRKFGMAHQLEEDLMRPLTFDVLAGKYAEHPFGDDGGTAAAKFLASVTYDAIESIVNLPAQAMAMLRKCARVMAHEGKPVAWVTPLGMPWVNRYHELNIEEMNLWLHDKRVRTRVADGHTKTIDKEKSANGVAPNFVHACDATHLLMVAAACARENITQIATVHDSFGCLASRAGRFRQIVREQFVELYEKHDVLAEVLEACRRDLTLHNQQRLPPVPDYGQLNLTEVLDAEFAFA